MATPDPAAVAEKLAIKVAGGHTIKSVFPLSSLAPAMIFTSSPHEAMRPFIFQLPATSGTMLAAIENPLTACAYQILSSLYRCVTYYSHLSYFIGLLSK